MKKLVIVFLCFIFLFGCAKEKEQSVEKTPKNSNVIHDFDYLDGQKIDDYDRIPQKKYETTYE